MLRHQQPMILIDRNQLRLASMRGTGFFDDILKVIKNPKPSQVLGGLAGLSTIGSAIPFAAPVLLPAAAVLGGTSAILRALGKGRKRRTVRRKKRKVGRGRKRKVGRPRKR